MEIALPHRGDATTRPAGIVVPPARMPLWHSGRMLKRWRYVASYGPEVMLCLGSAHIGPAWQVWWAVWDRGERRLTERTRLLFGRRRVSLGEPGRAAVNDGDVSVDLRFDERAGVETITPAGDAWIWTRKQAGIPVRGTVRVGTREWALDAPGFIDDSAGYHDRRTRWSWSAGLGRTVDGRAVAWNFAQGIHDRPEASEQSVWVDGEPRPAGPARFAPDLSWVEADGARLSFTAEATRARDDRLLIFRSRYEQPFGTFSGTLPGGLALAEGHGVMEHHDVLW